MSSLTGIRLLTLGRRCSRPAGWSVRGGVHGGGMGGSDELDDSIWRQSLALQGGGLKLRVPVPLLCLVGKVGLGLDLRPTIATGRDYIEQKWHEWADGFSAQEHHDPYVPYVGHQIARGGLAGRLKAASSLSTRPHLRAARAGVRWRRRRRGKVRSLPQVPVTATSPGRPKKASSPPAHARPAARTGRPTSPQQPPVT